MVVFEVTDVAAVSIGPFERDACFETAFSSLLSDKRKTKAKATMEAMVSEVSSKRLLFVVIFGEYYFETTS